MLIQLEKKADQTASSQRSWVGPRIPGAKNHLSRLIDPKNAFWRLCWQQAGDIYGESTLRIVNRLVLPV